MKYANFSFLSSEKVNGSMNLDYCKQEQNTLWDESRRFVNPQKVYVDLSQKLWDLKKDLLEEISEKALD